MPSMHNVVGLITGITNQTQKLTHATHGSHPQQLHKHRMPAEEEAAIAISPSTELRDA